MRIFFGIILLIWAVFEFFKSAKEYQKSREKMDMISLIASMIMIPSGCILLIAELVG